MYHSTVRFAHIFLYSILQVLASTLCDEFPRIHIRQGTLEGKTYGLEGGGGRTYGSFKGIPYAKPPLNELRFKAPEPPLPWKGVRTAYEHGSNCVGLNGITMKIGGDENCLSLNVYTPNFSKNKQQKHLLPVMIFIHGGAYKHGSGDVSDFGAEPLMYQDIVLVTINYRLGVSGFLCLDIPEVPGNAGLKDQVQSFKWVRDNIVEFNGDPDNVTIFGQSAGGHAVSLHCISPLSRGLFHRAIIQSGMLANDWTFSVDDRKQAFLLGKRLGNDTDDPYKLLEFLQNVPAIDLLGIKFPMLLRDNYINKGIYPYLPVVEKVPTQNTFLNSNPIELLNGDDAVTVPIMTGIVIGEGLMLLDNLNETIRHRTQYQELGVPRRMSWYIPLKMSYNLGSRVNEFYFKRNGMTVDSITDLESDLYVSYDVYWFSSLVASRFSTKVFFYIFNIKSERNIMELQLGLPKGSGVLHSTDLCYLFQSAPQKPLDLTSESFQLINRTTTLWANFASTGNPTPTNALGVTWPPFTSEKEDYLYMSDELINDRYPQRERFSFWNKIEEEVRPYTKH